MAVRFDRPIKSTPLPTRRAVANAVVAVAALLALAAISARLFSVPTSPPSPTAVRVPRAPHCPRRAAGAVGPQPISTHELPALLGVPRLVRAATALPASRQDAMAAARACDHPTSFLAAVLAQPRACTDGRPFAPRLRAAAREFAASRPALRPWLRFASQHDTLTMHIVPAHWPPADAGNSTFVREARALAVRFRKIVLVVSESDAELRQTMLSALRGAEIVPPQALLSVFDSGDAESMLSVMAHASNLLVHDGPFSALAALTNLHTVHYTNAMSDSYRTFALHGNLQNGAPVAREEYGLLLDEQRASMDAFAPEETCCDVRMLIGGVESKVFCSNAGGVRRRLEHGCWVLSVGSKGDFKFESEVLKMAPKCRIQTFDCTGEWPVPSEFGDRVKLHKLCVGPKGNSRVDYMTLREMIEFGARESGLPPGTAPVMAKVDAEGFEMRTMVELLDEDESFFPDHFAVEVHMLNEGFAGPPYEPLRGDFVPGPFNLTHGLPLKEALYFNERMSDAGYALVHRHDKPRCPFGCAEIGWVRRSLLPMAD